MSYFSLTLTTPTHLFCSLTHRLPTLSYFSVPPHHPIPDVLLAYASITRIFYLSLPLITSSHFLFSYSQITPSLVPPPTQLHRICSSNLPTNHPHFPTSPLLTTPHHLFFLLTHQSTPLSFLPHPPFTIPSHLSFSPTHLSTRLSYTPPPTTLSYLFSSFIH